MEHNQLLPKPSSHFIPLRRAIEMASLYRLQKENVLAAEFKNTGILPLCETFHRSDIDELLTKSGCQGLRVYLGMDESLKVRLLFVAVNENAEDILPEALEASSLLQDVTDIIEEGHRCPPICPPASPLNTP